MKYYCIVDKTKGKEGNNNILVMDNVIEKAYNRLTTNVRNKIGSCETFVSVLRDGAEIPSSWNIKVFTLDDEIYAIPSDNYYLMMIRDEIFRIVGSYSGYVSGLLAQDLMASSRNDVESLTSDSSYYAESKKDIRLTDGSYLPMTCYNFPIRIFN